MRAEQFVDGQNHCGDSDCEGVSEFRLWIVGHSLPSNSRGEGGWRTGVRVMLAGECVDKPICGDPERAVLCLFRKRAFMLDVQDRQPHRVRSAGDRLLEGDSERVEA
jgi:hypothetical protein